MEVLEAIRGRRSTRSYQATPVSDEDLGLVLEAARWAPSWANTQCWRFIVVRDRAVKAQLADMLKANRAARGVRQAPLLIVACAQLGQSGYFDGQPATDKGDWYMYDAALAMQNLALAAHSLGLATVHIGRFDGRAAAAILAVPPGFAVVSMTPLGYPDEVAEPPPRQELAEIVFNDRFGVKFLG
ncbi:MAG: nitroreductase family protein [Dehalococcoidales bacterium]